MEMNDHLRTENVSTAAGKFIRRSDHFPDHQRCRVTSSCHGDNEMTLMQLRRLWKTLLNKNERSRFEERKLCRTKTVKFLEAHICSQCERVRYLALDLLCGAVPRLEDKTDRLLEQLMPKVVRCLSENYSMEVKTKALYFLRAYSRHTNSVHRFIEMFCHLGIESDSDAIKISSLHGISMIFDRDIGDQLFSVLVPPVANLLNENSHPSVLLSCYRTLKRIHERVQDDRFYNLLGLSGAESTEIYTNFLAFEAKDPYLTSDTRNLTTVIAEYQKKRDRLHINKAFGVIEPAIFNRMATTRDCERAVMVNNMEMALKRACWNEIDLESHILDLIKLAAAFVSDPNKPTQMSGLEILKEVIQRTGFYLAPHLKSVVEILRGTLNSSNLKIKSKAQKILHKLMKSTHPMTVIWELLDVRESVQKEAVLRFVLGKLRCFSYCDFDLVSLFATLGREMEDEDPGIRSASRDCTGLLLAIMESSPVPGIKSQAVCLLLRNSCLQPETLRSVGIENGNSEGSREDFDSFSDTSTNTAPSTSQTIKSFPSGVQQSTIYIENVLPRNYHLYDSSASTLSFAKMCDDDQVMYEEGVLSEVYLNELARKSTTGCKRKSVLPFPINARGFPQSETSICRGGESTTTSNVLTGMTFDHSQLETPKHTSTPRRRWDLTPRGRPNRVPKAPEPTESSRSLFNDTLEGGDAPQYCEAKRSGGDWCESYSGSRSFEYCVEKGEDDFENTIVNAAENYTDANYEPHRAEHLKPSRSNGCQVEHLNPKKFNFNILQVSTPKTTESVQEVNEASESQCEEVLEVLPTSVSSPEHSDADITPTDGAKKIPNNNRAKRPARGKFVETLSADADPDSFKRKIEGGRGRSTKNDTMKHPTNNRRKVGDVPCKREPLKSSNAPKSKSKMAAYKPVPSRILQNLTSGRRTSGSGKSDEFPPAEPVHISDLDCGEETPASTFQASFQGSDGRNSYVETESDAHQEFPGDLLLDTDIEQDSQANFEDLDSSIVEVDCEIERPDSEIPEEISGNDLVSAVEERVDGNLTAKGSPSYTADDEDLEDVEPWTKGKEIPRTPVGTSGKKKFARPNKTKEGNKTRSTEAKTKLVIKNKKPIEKKLKITEVKKSRLIQINKSTPSIPREREDTKTPEHKATDRESDESNVVNCLPDNVAVGCQWRRDLEYAVKGGTCIWAQRFEKTVERMQPYPSNEVAENEMKKAIEDLYGKAWKSKEEAMGVVIRLAKHHPETVYDNIPKIVVAVCNEVRNFRQSVAGKAILTAGYLYELMGKKLENKLRLVVGVLLAKSGNRTLAAYFRLVIKSLFKIVHATSSQKAALAFIHEGGRHPNKASRETAAQFLALLTETLGSVNSLSSPLANHMLKCSALFVFDCSALTRHCGKRMFQILRQNPNFEKLKDHYLDITTAQNLSKVLELIETKGVSEQLLPINIIK